MFLTYSARGLQKKTPQRELRGVSFRREVQLDRADGTPDRDQPTTLLEFNSSTGWTSPHRAPLNVRTIYEGLVADRPVSIPVAAPDQPMPTGAGPQNVPEVRRSRPLSSHTDDVHRQAVAMPCVMRGSTLCDGSTPIVVLAPKAVQKRLPLVGAEGFKDLRGVAPCLHVGNHPLDGFTEERGEECHVRLHRDFSGREGQRTHFSILPSIRLTRSLMSRVRL